MFIYIYLFFFTYKTLKYAQNALNYSTLLAVKTGRGSNRMNKKFSILKNKQLGRGQDRAILPLCIRPNHLMLNLKEMTLIDIHTHPAPASPQPSVMLRTHCT